MLTINEVLSGATYSCAAGMGFWSWYCLIGMALLVSTFILAFLYIWANIFRNNNLISYVKLEIYELIISAFLAVVLLSLVNAMSSIPVTMFLPAEFLPEGVTADMNMYATTEKYFLEVGEDMATWLQMNYALSVYADAMASVTPYSRPLGVGLVSAPLAGFASPFKQLLYNMSVALSIAYIVNYAQLYTFIFFTAAFLKYYLPAGIFLRCFTPTRRIGGALIGMAVVFLFIFPPLTTVTYAMFYNESFGPMETIRNFLDHYFDTNFDGNYLRNALENFFSDNLSGGIGNFVSGSVGGLGRILQRIVGGTFLLMFLVPISIIGRAFALGFIMPAFNIMIFVHAGKYLTKSFGEEVDLTTITRLI